MFTAITTSKIWFGNKMTPHMIFVTMTQGKTISHVERDQSTGWGAQLFIDLDLLESLMMASSTPDSP